MDQKVAELLNEQINKEFFSAYLYLDIANYYTDLDLDGFANWYTIQAQEERDHALLFIRTMQFLDWFVKEQGEEEKNADSLVKKYKLYGDDPKSLYLLNQELAGRVYSAPSLVL